MRPDQIILEPVLTEKANELREGEVRSYSFMIDPRANKTMAKWAVEQLFQVKAIKCNVLWVKSKPRTTRTKSGVRQGSRVRGRRRLSPSRPETVSTRLTVYRRGDRYGS